MKKIIFIIFIFCCSFLYSSTSKIQEEIINLWLDYFFEEDNFSYIGEINIKKNNYKIFQNFHQFSKNGSTSRIVVVENETIKGFYVHIQSIPKKVMIKCDGFQD